MIPQINEYHKFVYIDSILFDLSVVPFKTLPEDATQDAKLFHVIQYLKGISQVNNLNFELDGVNIFIKAGDYPKAEIVDLGLLPEETLLKLKDLKWDVINFHGRSLVEVPVAHEKYLDQIKDIKPYPFELQFVILFYDNELSIKNGIDLGTYIQMNVNFFDLVYNRKFNEVLSSSFGARPTNRLGFSLLSNPRRLKMSLNETITTNLTGLIGTESTIAIEDEIPYQTSSTSADGFRTQNNIDFVKAGFVIRVNSAESNDGLMFDFNIENSNVDFDSLIGSLPVVQRRLIQSRKQLVVDEVLEIARIESVIESDNRSGLPFLPKIFAKDKKSTKGTISLLVKRIR